MITTLLAFSLAQLQQAPSLPVGMNPAFTKVVLQVERSLSSGDVAAATAASKLLPSHDVTFEWDDSNVPASQRDGFKGARDRTFKEWRRVAGSFSFKEAKPANIRFHFADLLPLNPQTQVPAGAQFSFSEESGKPRLDVTIALKRNNPPGPAGTTDVHNEVGYALCAYFGVVENKGFGPFNSRTDYSTNNPTRLTNGEVSLAEAAVKLSSDLRDAIHGNVRIKPSEPSADIESNVVERPPVLQGEEQGFKLKIKNGGTNALNLRIRPDCFCLLPRYPAQLAPGEEGIIDTSIDTNSFVGKLHHYLTVYSNDPEKPVQQIDVHFEVKPMYRFVMADADVVQLSDKGGSADVLLLVNPAAKLKPVSAQMTGIGGKVKFEPWTGTVAGEAEKQSGYKFHLDLQSTVVPGRIETTLLVDTDSHSYPSIQFPVRVQKGIAAMPVSVFLGEVDPHPLTATLFLSRPKTPFKIVKVESSSPFFSASFVPNGSDWEYRGALVFNGKADYGLLNATLTVYTDDAKQPKIMIPISGVVR